ncbi:family 10 glycosylhydrolase [Botrimarina sp.]|uniref:glycoside hydrolase family 10 protein n=1 Tax=Botrimarina sp. TaxID=2795802 RepID=UPI0032EB2645
MHQPSSLTGALFAAALITSCWAAASEPPEPPREFRAAWIATVANIDWPSKKGLSVEQQQRELIELLDTAVRLNLNAIVLQARPACDALYQSDLEPWSPYLTGEYGAAPEPFYDPLEFACNEAHRRGLQLHAWLNPYRAWHSSGGDELPEGHPGERNPSMVRRYGAQWWLDPGDLDASAHSLAVVKDIVTRYEVDGLHFDDYFYPYPVTEKNADGETVEVPFPDDATYGAYADKEEAAGREPLARDDWRRQNVNDFIHAVSREVRGAKPGVLFGVSPFGIWRPRHPPSIQGFDPYDKLYADAKLWLEEGWVDYFAPQLYWPIEQKPQSYPVLLRWWAGHNPQQRHLWPGLFTSRVGRGEGRGWEADQIVRQIEVTREVDGAGGNIHFSMKALARDYGGLIDALQEGPYAQPALVPRSPWVEQPQGGEPAAPSGARWSSGAGDAKVVWEAGAGEPLVWVVQTLRDGRWSTAVLPAARREATIGPAEGVECVAIRAASRLGELSEAALLDAP